MPPKQKQSQAGKFKPLKRPARKAAAVVEVPSSAAAAPLPAAESGVADVGGDVTRVGSGGDPGGGEGGRASRSRGRGRGRSPRGRGGRGGRGGGRGGRGRGRGRFVVPAGAAFFTGGMAQRAAAGGAAASATNEGDADVDMDMGGGEEAAAPVAKAAAKTGGSKAARSTAKSAAAATAREEDEEEIVAEVWDADEADLTREAKEKAETQQAKKKASRRRTKADAEAPAVHGSTGVDEAFTYDSDSSMEEDDSGGFPMPPTQLPFPAPLGQATMYDCQDGPNEEEKKSSEGEAQIASLPTAPSRTSDPPVKSPFLNLNGASEEEKKKEAEAWFLMKFPTRLPQLDANSTTAASSKWTAVKSEFGEESGVGGGAHTDAGEGASSRPRGYDDALWHAVPGRYGRIVVRQSGRTELVLGGGESGEPEVRMLVHEGLQCGFRQEAVGVDPAGRTFVALGGVEKSLVVTPDVERAFAAS
ncbi:hypothetical protein ACHAXT_007696 [Thalassiosira profunda]